jgi:putative ABC transport system substrate-binding protein
VATGIVASLARPGGNITGQTYMHLEVQSKRLELLKETAPYLVRAAVLFNPDNPFSRMVISALENAAKSLMIQMENFPVRGPDELANAFAVMAERSVGAICTDDDGWLLANNKTIAELAVKHRVLSTGRVEGAQAGLLIGYGENLLDMFRSAASYVDRILKGANPAQLPIQRPIRFELAVNLTTAKAIGLKVPQSILARADSVIE